MKFVGIVAALIVALFGLEIPKAEVVKASLPGDVDIRCASASKDSLSLTLKLIADHDDDRVSFDIIRDEEDRSIFGVFEVDLINSKSEIVSSIAGEWTGDERVIGSFMFPKGLPTGIYFVRTTASAGVAEDSLESQEFNRYFSVRSGDVTEATFEQWMAALEVSE